MRVPVCVRRPDEWQHARYQPLVLGGGGLARGVRRIEVNDGFPRFHHIEPISRNDLQIRRIVLEQLFLPNTPGEEGFFEREFLLKLGNLRVLLPVLFENGNGCNHSGNTECHDDNENEKPVEDMEPAFVVPAFVVAVGGFVHVRWEWLWGKGPRLSI